MELTVENLTNLFAAFENEKSTRAAVAKQELLAASPKRKPKGTSPLPDTSPNSGNRLYGFKGVGVVRVIRGEATTIGIRTPRRYQVVNRKRPAGCKDTGEMPKRNRRRIDAQMDKYFDQGSDDNVFEKDEDPDLDSHSE